MRFQGKVSWWFYAIMIGTAALLIPLIVVSAWIDPNGVVLAVDLFVFAALESFCASIVLRNYVELQEDSLLIVFGFIRTRIPYRSIVSLAATGDPSSSLAASLDRIKITCRDQSSVMIAVKEKEKFFREMGKQNTGIAMQPFT